MAADEQPPGTCIDPERRHDVTIASGLPDPFAGPHGQALRELVDIMTSRNSIRAIVLFGSRARGDHVADSDFDLLVIHASDAKPAAASKQELSWPRLPISLDTSSWPDALIERIIEEAIRLAPELGAAYWNTSDGQKVAQILTGTVLFGHDYIERCRKRCPKLGELAPLQRPQDLTPDVRDGLNILQRRLLYTLHLLGPRVYRKSARVITECQSRFQPFAGSLLYHSLTAMAQPWRARYPLIDGRGNFGSIHGDPPAGMRYTEIRIAPLTLEWLAEMDRGAGEFSRTHSGSPDELVTLPVSLPQLLLNGAHDFRSDDAVLLPPYNLAEICDALLALLDDPALPQEQLRRIVPGPDFPTGGVMEGAALHEIIDTGRGSLTLRGRVRVQQQADRIVLLITELPFFSSAALLLEEVAALVAPKGRSTGITELSDRSDTDGMRLELVLDATAEPDAVLALLAGLASFQQVIDVEHTALVAGTAQVVPLRRVLEEFITFRKASLRRGAQFTAANAHARISLIDAILQAAADIDSVCAALRETTTDQQAHALLCERYSWSDEQLRAVLRESLAAAQPETRIRFQHERATLLAQCSEAEAVLDDEASVVEMMRQQTQRLRRDYGDTRRTSIA